MKDFDRRSFLKISGAALGIGVLYQVAPMASAEAVETFRLLGRNTGETVTPFSFIQLSDAHVGFNGPPDPLGTKAFERAVEMVNALPRQPDLVLVNVSRAKPEVGPEQLAWLKKDLERFPKAAPIVVFTHRPLFDLKPEWEWFTSDGDEVMNVLAGYDNVTVLYGHIHRDDDHQV